MLNETMRTSEYYDCSSSQPSEWFRDSIHYTSKIQMYKFYIKKAEA